MKRAPRRDAAADLLHDLPEGGAHGDFDQAGPADLAGEREHLRAFAGRGSDAGELVRAVADDPGHHSQRLDVVDEGGLAPEAGLRGERRAQAGHAAAAFHRGNQGRFLAADKSAGPFLDGDMEGVVAPEQVSAQPAALLALRQGGLHSPQGLGIFVADVEDGLVRSDRDGGDGQPFNDPVGEGFEDHAVHECARVAFVAVADHVFGFGGLLAEPCAISGRWETLRPRDRASRTAPWS